MKEGSRFEGFLLQELKNGNERAFDQLFKDHYRNLCRFACSMVHDEDTCHSLVQHVFVKIWENRASLDHVEHFTPYLTRMVKNHCINHLQREKRNVKYSGSAFETEAGSASDSQLEASELEEKLVVALTLLPERCKMAFEYSRFEDFSYKEIAEKMGISTKGVEALIGRSLKLLRVSLKDYLPSSKRGKSGGIALFLILSKVKKAL